MDERRKAERLEEEDNEVTIVVDSAENNHSEAKLRDIYINNYIKDISKLGVGIKTNIHLPVDALIELEFTTKGLREQIKTLGKVKWIKVIIQDKSYEAGIEFCGSPDETVKKLEDYISWKLKNRLHKDPLLHTDSGESHAAAVTDQSAVKPGEAKVVEAKDLPPNKNRKLASVTILSLCIVVLITLLLAISGYIPELNGWLFPDIHKKTAQTFPQVSVTQGPETPPAPSPEVSNLHSVPEAAPASAPLPATTTPPPAKTPEATQIIKVIGNSDSKRYHLPGMKYYNAVKVRHRVEFDSEADAVKAGYSKAPQ